MSGEVGNGIESYELVEGNHNAGTLDTYRITFTDGTTKEIQIYNGKDGKGSGDMQKLIYDTDDDGIVEEADHAKTADNAMKATSADMATNADKADHSKTADNASKVNNHTVDSNVPENAKFTDTIIEIHKYRLDISQDTALGAEIEVPFYYKVGTDVLDVYYVGQRLIKCSTYDDLGTGHYSEVGENNSISNKIKITSDWKASMGNYFEFVVRGEYSV